MFARVSFSFVVAIAFLLCQALATQHSALGPCKTAIKKTNRLLTGRGLTGVRLVDVDKDSSGVSSRRLMQDVSCEWDAEEEECGISDASLAKLFLESTSPIGRVIGQVGTCAAQSRKRQCTKVGYCFWDRPECTFADFSIGNEDSPCVKHAPGLFAYLAADNQCEMHRTRAVCEAPICEWNAEEGACGADIFEAFFASFNGSQDGNVDNVDDAIDSFGSEGDKQFLAASLKCAGKDSASCTGDCEWDSEDESCGPTARAIFEALVPEDYTSGDGVCDFMSFLAQSDCLDYRTQKECLDDDTCTYDEDGCSPDASALGVNIILEDPDLLEQLVTAGARCGRSTTEEKCA